MKTAAEQQALEAAAVAAREQLQNEVVRRTRAEALAADACAADERGRVALLEAVRTERAGIEHLRDLLDGVRVQLEAYRSKEHAKAQQEKERSDKVRRQ